MSLQEKPLPADDSAASLKAALAERTRELEEARERETATAEVLRVISGSPGDLQAVFKAVLENATRLCEAKFGTLYRYDGKSFYQAAGSGTPAALIKYQKQQGPFLPESETLLDRVLQTRKVAHTDDYAAEPKLGMSAKYGGARSTVAVPMLHEDQLVGVIVIYRQEVRPFTEKQIELLKNFAAQAVIAIENARLMSEQRDALDRQTATSEVLKVIASSPTDVQPVFDAIAHSAMRLFGGQSATVTRVVGDEIHLAALTAGSDEGIKAVQSSFPSLLSSTGIHSRVARSGQPAFRFDIENEPDVAPAVKELARARGYRSILVVPMLRDGAAIGTIGVTRREPGAFSNDQIALLGSFADQAVIAIENARLFAAEQQRTKELGEALERQTATSEVLGVISTSPGELESVFKTILVNAMRLCEGSFGLMHLREGKGFRVAEIHNIPPALAAWRGESFVPIPEDPLGRMLATNQKVHIADVRTEPAYKMGFAPFLALVDGGGARTLLGVPLLKDGELIGAIAVYRQEVREFTEKHVALVESFAAQAVIAIENARLLSELRESLAQQTATSEVLQVISSSPGELEPVFHAMLTNATRICEAKFGVLYHYSDGAFYPGALVNAPPAYEEFVEKRGRFRPRAGNALDRVLQTKSAIRSEDVAGESVPTPSAKLAGARSQIIVPMLKEDDLIGAIAIYRQEVRSFTDKQAALLTNFAAQAVIAIENARLLSELRETLERQTATSEVLKVISSSPGELEPVFNAMLENAVRICGAKCGTLFLSESEDTARAVAQFGATSSYAEDLKQRPVIALGEGALGRCARTKQPVQVADVQADPAYLNDPPRLAIMKLNGARTMFNVPMLKDNEVIGQIAIYRQEVLPFTDKQVELLQNFAAQAVIAIENTRLLSELRETLERQTATTEVLKVISSSPGELQPVFESILENATRICGAKFGNLLLHENGAFRRVALHGASAAWAHDAARQSSFVPSPVNPIGRMLNTKQVVHVPDMATDRAYLERDPAIIPLVESAGARTIVGVPMLKDNELVGAIAIFRQEVRPFSDKQIELLQNFAAQAVIAIENARLLTELRETLDRQTATAEVLGVISSSPGELAPVFNAMLENAARICEAKFANLFLYSESEKAFRLVANKNAPAAYAERWAKNPALSIAENRVNPLARLAETKRLVDILDLKSESGYMDRDPRFVALVEAAGARTHVLIPMLKEGALVGAIAVYRQEVRAFSEKQIELLTNFAAQAVIAIENARLLSELRESLERQTATSEVLRVISSSPGDLEPVFESILKNATEICEAKFATLFRFDGETFFPASHIGAPPELVEAHSKRGAFKAVEGTTLYKVWQTKNAIQTEDDAKAPKPGHHVVFGGARSTVGVPMLKDGQLIGIIVIYRQEVRPFTDKQIELVQNFAAQAVIAIENTRLLSELRESLQQQTATANVLKVISTSPGELQPVFDTMLAKATELCDAAYGTMWLRDGDVIRVVAYHGELPKAFMEIWRTGSVISPDADAPVARSMRSGEPVYVEDLREDRGYREGNPLQVAAADIGGIRTLVSVPMLKEGGNIGGITIYRREVKPFGEKQIELVKNFAAQAVIAIENARLLNELHERTDDLTESLEQQTATSDILQVISNSPTDTQPVFETIAQSGTKLFPQAAVSLALRDGDQVKAVAIAERDSARAEAWKSRFPFPLTREYMHGVAILDAKVVDIPDIEHAPAEFAVGARNFMASGYRALTMVPMMRGNAAIGVLSVVRMAPGPLSDKQLALVKTFAAQAVIAIENTRLFNELRERTDDLTESLAQQTATSEVLEVISSSPGELDPVFNSILDNAVRICGAQFGILALFDGTDMRLGATHNAPVEFAKGRPIGTAIPLHLSPLGVVVRTKEKLHIADLAVETQYAKSLLVTLARARSMLAVPMLKDNELVGVINIYRQEVRPFNDKQIEVLENFAAQAVIAIENARLLNELRQRTDDLTETLQQQTATSDILEVISNSPTDSQPAFDAIVRSGLKLFPDAAVMIALPDGDMVKGVAIADADAAGAEALRGRFPLPLTHEFITSTAILDRREVDLPDAQDAPAELTAGARNFLASGYRAMTVMPMMRGESAIGTLNVMRRRPGPLSDKQKELLRTFASQAVIAIENTRLFNELRERTDDLSESLQQQTATADVLKVISRSTFDLQTVLNTLTESASRLCGADKGVISLLAGDAYVVRANYGFSAEAIRWAVEHPLRPGRDSMTGRVALEGKAIHIPDVLADPEYKAIGHQKAFGYRTNLGVPLLREGTTIGVFALTRDTVNPFTEKQIALATTFADQAVIAIENVRLFDEVQARTEDLTESLQQQTATAEVLSVMSRSQFDLAPILQSVVDTAARLCRAEKAVIFRLEDGLYRFAAGHSLDPKYIEIEMATLIAPGPGTAVGRAAMNKQVVRIDDAFSDPHYAAKDDAKIGDVRSTIGVPLMREGEAIGVIALARGRVEPFNEREIDLVTTFADQAVIAIENVRLFEEVQARTEDLSESLQQQIATADVLKLISRSTFDLQPVLDTLVESASRLCAADKGTIFLRDGDVFRLRANQGFSGEAEEYAREHPMQVNRGSATGRVVLENKAVHIPDVLADPEYTVSGYQKTFGYRTILSVPLLREGTAIGVFSLTRDEVSPFSEKQVDLVTTFADQAVIAIENVRLFDEIQDKSRQLEEASKHKSQFLANMSHELRTPLNAILGYTELIADGVYGDTPEKVQVTLKRVMTNGRHLLGLINDVLDLSKIEAGQLTLSLTDYSMKDVVHNVYGAVEPLASEKKLGFKVEIAPDMAAGHGDERRLTQVLLNLVGNAIKFTDEGQVVIKASQNNGAFSVAVCDTGPGISEDDQKKLFQEFQQADSSTTKKKGGTGLGLAISKKIIEMHGGRIWLESQVGKGSIFAFTVPTRAEQAKRQ